MLPNASSYTHVQRPSWHLELTTASGMSKEQWKKLKEQERTKNKGKDLSKVGITTFQSRSFMDWQKSGGGNLFPVDPTKVKDPSKVPYMQRPGGKADGSDLKKGASGAGAGGGFFRFGGPAKKDDTPPSQPPAKNVNWWTLN
jgi:hypothetical protein